LKIWTAAGDSASEIRTRGVMAEFLCDQRNQRSMWG
jgi:hypothetical protein